MGRAARPTTATPETPGVPDDDDAIRIAVSPGADGPVVALAGDLDMAAEEPVARALRAAEASRPPVLSVDLSALDFIDSTGSRILIDAHRRAGAEGRRLVVVTGDGVARVLLERSGLHRHLCVVPHRRGADPT